MRSLKGKRWLLLLKQINKTGLCLSLLFFFWSLSGKISAQEYSFRFNRTPASDALSEAARQTGIKLAFDAGELEKVFITGNYSGKSPESILSAILEGTGFRFRLEYGTYLIVRKKEDVSRERQVFTLTGMVVDKESGERLPYPNVQVVKENRYLLSSVEGTFSFSVRDTSAILLKVSYLGYQTTEKQVSVSDKEAIQIALTRNVHTIETVKVTGGWSDMASFTRQAGQLVFNPARFTDLPSFGETDIFRSLQLLPGIASSENSADLNIRGSSSDQNLVMFDGYTLYNLDHFFGEFSALNPQIIKDIQVYRGGFDSRYGERVSGIVDITGKSGNQYKPVINGNLNMISGSLTAEIPVGKKLTLVAGGRRAYSDVYSTYLTDALLSNLMSRIPTSPGQNTNEIKPDFTFSDYNLKMTWRPGQRDNVYFSLYGARDFLDNSNYFEKNQLGIDTKDINKWGNYGLGVSWRRQWKNSLYTEWQSGHSGYYNDYFNTTYLRGKPHGQPGQGKPQDPDSIRITNEKNKLEDFFVSLKGFYPAGQKNQLEAGMTVRLNRFAYYKDADLQLVYNDMENSGVLSSLYFQDKITLTRRWTVKPGLRLSYSGNTNRVYPEPRFSASYSSGKGFIFKIATGRYYQFLNKLVSEQTYGYNRNFWVLADGLNHPVVSSNHFIVGASLEKGHFFFEAEGYYKSIDGIEEYLFFTPDQRNKTPGNPKENGWDKFITGRGKAYGMDLMAKYESRGYTGWIAWSVSKSIRNFNEINHNADIPAPFDRTHDVKWVNILPLKNWNISSLLYYSTGKPYIKSSQKDPNFSTTRVYSRLPDYFRTDISANYNLKLKKALVKPGISVINLFNTTNYFDIYSREFEFQNTTTWQTTLVKAQELTFNFFVQFRF